MPEILVGFNPNRPYGVASCMISGSEYAVAAQFRYDDMAGISNMFPKEFADSLRELAGRIESGETKWEFVNP